MGDSVHRRVMDRIVNLFERPLIQNNLRAIYVEFLIQELLGNDWEHSGGDWAAVDLEHVDGTKLEIKQSAARQTWSPPERGYAQPRFSIRPPKQVCEGSVLTDRTGRQADIYLFAWHGELGDIADHRAPEQWVFYPLQTKELPDQNSIGLSRLRTIARPSTAGQLRDRIEHLRITRQTE